MRSLMNFTKENIYSLVKTYVDNKGLISSPYNVSLIKSIQVTMRFF